MQVYKYYGKKDISINSEINLDNLYSKSHLESEKIIVEKFFKQRNMFTILRMGNVFGFRKNNKTRGIYSNLIHSFCSIGLKKGKIFIKNGSIQRTYIPSQIFVNMINLIINKDLFYNTIENVSYKNLTLKEVSYIIQKRFKLLFKHNIIVKIEKFNYGKKFNIKNKYIKFNIDYKKIYFEIDQLFKILKKKVKT